VRYGISLANIGSYADPRAAVRIARVAESSGWDGFFIWDHLAFVWGVPAADPWIVLAAVASATDRVRIGTLVTPVARRRPQVLAHAVATLDVLSGGRVIFGAGLGGVEREFGAFGDVTDPKIRAEMLDEGLELLRLFWSGAEVRHRGEHYVVDRVKLAVTPVQEHLPIWIGGNRTASLRRAARWDGWCPGTSDPSGGTLSPVELSRRAATINRAEPFEIAVLGERNGDDPRAYEEAGATWWIENVHDRRGTYDEMVALVEAGPRV
jgi:alkanesulfonate monooxygenase SsuD/methylene tetrahydromethanopterin reductase-like flavin-dependent oxidoreductase (luciferase family)